MKQVYATHGFISTNLKKEEKVQLKTYEESLDYLITYLQNSNDKVMLVFLDLEEITTKTLSIYWYNGKFLNFEKARGLLKEYLKGE